ncbi:DUF3949 domain-containing protein [Mesobacillus thioparans]|uniref:DUF3949 domain-containing protein n=1 Tax=Mesobacillus thioparans TaxID=370439 RepID=UPI0039EF803F
MEELKKKRNQKQSEIYEEMPVQEEVLHMNLQSNPLFIPANIIAGIIYKTRHRQWFSLEVLMKAVFVKIVVKILKPILTW